MLAPLTETNTIFSDHAKAPQHAGTELFHGDRINWSLLTGMDANWDNPWRYVGVVNFDFVLNRLPSVITDLRDYLYSDLKPQHVFWGHLGATTRVTDINLSGLGGAGDVEDATQVDFCLVNIFNENAMMYVPTSGALFIGSGAVADDDKSADDLALAQLHTKNVYTLNALRDFGRKHSRRLRSSTWILHAVVGIINHSVLHGYRPVVTLDVDDHSLEIEARLDADRLLLLHVRGSGIVEGQIYSKLSETKSISRTKASDFLAWLVSQDGQDT